MRFWKYLLTIAIGLAMAFPSGWGAEGVFYENYGVRFTKPDGWEFRPSEDWHTVFQIIKKEKTESNPLLIHMRVRATFGKPLVVFSKIFEDGLKKSYPHLHLLSQRKQMEMGRLAERRVYSIPDADQEKEIYLSCVCITDGEVGYLVLYIAGADQFEAVQKSAMEPVENTVKPKWRKR